MTIHLNVLDIPTQFIVITREKYSKLPQPSREDAYDRAMSAINESFQALRALTAAQESAQVRARLHLQQTVFVQMACYRAIDKIAGIENSAVQCGNHKTAALGQGYFLTLEMLVNNTQLADFEDVVVLRTK